MKLKPGIRHPSSGENLRLLPSYFRLSFLGHRHIHPTEESLEAFATRMSQNLPRIAFFLDLAFVQEHDATGDLAGELHFVGHHYHRHTLFGQVAHY